MGCRESLELKMDQKLAAAYGVHELRNPTEMSTAICKGNTASVPSWYKPGTWWVEKTTPASDEIPETAVT